METSTALRDALGRDEFEVYYQPIVDLHTGATVGHEALLRWHRGGQLISPAGFIPVAEASAIIVPIGAWVLDQALARVAQLRRVDPTLHVAVNVSARQLRGQDLLATVTTLLTEHGLPGEALWLELTETALVQDVPAALTTLRALHQAGVVICVDDFGTAYSALSYLQTFPISVVKIDGSFVRALGQEPARSSLVAAVQHMATDLGLRTVAEGVETAEQEQQLRALGCRLVQGYRFGRPAPASTDQVTPPRRRSMLEPSGKEPTVSAGAEAATTDMVIASALSNPTLSALNRDLREDPGEERPSRQGAGA